jgi:cytochrome c oxidase subunit IV
MVWVEPWILLFIRTDLYYLIANYLGCKNLMRDTEVFLRNVLSEGLSPLVFFHAVHSQPPT